MGNCDSRKVAAAASVTSPSAPKRKFLVVIDDTPESDRAVTFAANRVHHVGGSVVLLSVLQTQDFAQFLGVEEVMRAEAREEIERLLDARLARIASIMEAMRASPALPPSATSGPKP
jgi:nucleotide-binding universal stress UspA family protein